MANAGTGSYNTIKVVARFRPPNKTELANGGEQIVNFETEDTCNITARDATGAFTFDRVFDIASQQADVFDFSIRPTVDDILNGYNGTVFAYGQTGAGKSYTMMGSDIDDPVAKGIIPRIVEQIFASILASPGNIEYTVRVSYMEIYMERIRDLLQPQNDNLPVHEEKNRGVYVKGLLEIYVSSVLEVYEVMRRGGTARAVAATNMNQESSRSHSIFVLTVAQKNVETGSAKSGQLFLVDLAGSEKVGKTGASGQTLEEAKKINKSLSALGMVINSLTDGKSTHIPYRDSKLTRILQESLGGNSRTTLIINCSPSSYNAEETLSTLRFGVRAKAIKNKAKINAELSPAELKALLKKAQSQIVTFETYVSGLESEVQVWRDGGTVPKEKWAVALADGVSGRRLEPKQQRPGTPSPIPDSMRSETPSRSDSRLGERSSTPSVALEKDEREEFLRRENELQDQLSEKETVIANAEKSLKEAREELQYLKETSSQTGKDNEKLGSEISELKMQLERVAFESKETTITVDSLKEANAELTTELDDVKQQLLDARVSARETASYSEEKQKKKDEKMAEMMASFEINSDATSENDQRLRRCIDEVNKLQIASVAGEAITSDALEKVRTDLTETRRGVIQADAGLRRRADEEAEREQRRRIAEEKLRSLQRDYEGLLTRNLSPSDVEEVRSRLSQAYAESHSAEVTNITELRKDLAKKDEEIRLLRTNMTQLEQQQQQRNPTAANGVPVSPTAVVSNRDRAVQQQIANFDAIKKSLMRDLQNRCERVVELEISLDETREQYNNVLRTSNSRGQQKKMAFLERNLEQLTHVQRQLVEQNGGLKKEVAIAERKLIARNDRIQSLEALLVESQEKLTEANHRFESQLGALKERLEAAKIGSMKGLGAARGDVNYSFGGGPRIAKPLRGGGGTYDGGGSGAGGATWWAPSVPTVSNLQMQDAGADRPKRSSWFFDRR